MKTGPLACRHARAVCLVQQAMPCRGTHCIALLDCADWTVGKLGEMTDQWPALSTMEHRDIEGSTRARQRDFACADWTRRKPSHAALLTPVHSGGASGLGKQQKRERGSVHQTCVDKHRTHSRRRRLGYSENNCHSARGNSGGNSATVPQMGRGLSIPTPGITLTILLTAIQPPQQLRRN